MIGIHSPEFDWEKRRGAVEDAVRKHDLDYPQYLDTDFSYWRALGNRYWPAVYLVDRQGTVRNVHIGEIHRGTDDARQIQLQIEDLLGEPRDGSPDQSR